MSNHQIIIGWKEVSSVVSQGTVLGPILFNVLMTWKVELTIHLVNLWMTSS